MDDPAENNDQTSSQLEEINVTDSLTARPITLPISPSRRARPVEADHPGQDEADGGEEYSDEKPSISQLMIKYASQDENYSGIDVVSSPLDTATSPPVDSLPSIHNMEKGGKPMKNKMESYWRKVSADGGGARKDGMGEKKQAVMALRINKGEKNLSLYGNGKLVDKVVASPPDSDRRCLFIYHNAPGAHLLSLNPDESPKVQPIYKPNTEHYGEVFSFYKYDVETSPETLAVKVESKTHVYLALDYTNEDDAKLVAIEESVMEQVLIKTNVGSSDRMIKPIVNVRHYLGAKGKNDTAFYFKTGKNYYFVTVMKDQIHLGVEKVATADHNEATFTHYLTFAPMDLDNCPRLEPADHNDGPMSEMLAISTAPETDGDLKTHVKSSASSPGFSTGSDPTSPTPPNSSDKSKDHGVIASADSGVESEARDSQEDESTTV